MQPDNPFSTPQVELLEPPAQPVLPGWSRRQLQVLGMLALVATLGDALQMLLMLASTWLSDSQAAQLVRYTDWMSAVLLLIGCYLLMRFKALAEQRFAASGLGAPVWLLVGLSLLMGVMDFWLGARLFAGLNPVTLLYITLLVLMGSTMVWLGIRLLRVSLPYPSLRVMAWMNVIGGVLLASVVLIMLSTLPLLASGVAMALVFLRAANELD
ncbi:hypothetical protein [Pseudomonas sp. AA-38]|uniref:hypothetical protein n=1 Tax=Pseudomonas sp. AA-38 TaxID=3028807 RepID=UPI0023F77254|nr:hypothetical protein [Pseudomonas sp. AA-38]